MMNVENKTVDIERFMTDTLREYAFHDTNLHGVEVVENGVNLLFSEGIYRNDEHGKELFLTPRCEIRLQIRVFDPAKVWEHISVQKRKRKKVLDLDFSVFLGLFKKNALKIYMQYHSFFSQVIMFRGWIGETEIEWEITEVENVTLRFFGESAEG